MNISRPIERSAAAKSLKFAQFAPITSTSSGFEPLESHGEASTLSTGHEGILDQPVFLAFRSRKSKVHFPEFGKYTVIGLRV